MDIYNPCEENKIIHNSEVVQHQLKLEQPIIDLENILRILHSEFNLFREISIFFKKKH